MRSGSVKIVDRVSAIEAIKRLGEEDLLFLNRLIVERSTSFPRPAPPR